jgi:hypothetical protein
VAGRTHGLNSSYNHGCRCDLCRAASRAHHQTKYVAARGERPCSVCGQLFTKPSGSQKRCDDCRARNVRSMGLCDGCGDVYFAGSLAGRFCSRACYIASRYPGGAGPSRKNHRSRAKFFGVRYERVDRLEVFARDGWFCLLCVTPVDPALRWPHLMSASLDHVVPMSRGGDHSYLNVQTAHLSCNIAKGNRAGHAAA